jgi:Fe-Mn family superoxide dismutase
VNALEGEDALLEKDVEEVLRDLASVPESKRQAVINNGGGYFNHRLFWTILGPNKTMPSGELLEAIKKEFDSFDNFKDEFSKAAATRFGSGWAWLLVTDGGDLKVTSTANQDAPFDQGTPILGIDVWEHAYYLNYQNRRPDYIKSFWQVVNWNQVAEYYKAAK